MSRFRLLVCAACVACAFSACADTVYLKNGKTLEGEVIKDDGKVVVLRVTDGEITLQAADVEAIERESPLVTRLNLARHQLELGYLERATGMFEELARDNPKAPEARRSLAGAYSVQAQKYLELHRFADARAAYEKLLKLDPNGELAPHNAAQALRQLQAAEQQADGAVAQARALADAADWTGAIAAYDKALAFTPDVRAAVAPEMAQCHVKRALASARDGNALNAAADLEAALRLDPCLADRLETLYASCALPGILESLARGDLAAAQVDLKRVLGLAPANKSVLYVAGRTEEALGRVPAAANAYAQALRTRVANPTPAYTLQLRAKLEAELGITGNKWKIDTTFAELTGYAATSSGPAQKLETEHFLILHYNEALAREVASRAEAARLRIVSALDLPGWKGQARIYLHRTRAEYTAHTGQPEWTGGISKFPSEGTRSGAYELHSWQTSPRLLTSVLPHEIAHLVVSSSLPETARLPKALHEGFAVMMEPSFRHDYFLSFLRGRFKSQDFIPLADLLTRHDYPRDPEFFYAEGYALLEYLSRQKGAAAVAGLLKNVAGGAQAQAELVRLSGFASLSELEAAWKAWIMSAK
jgi:tetratricopeptide (TPR) repeat protein